MAASSIVIKVKYEDTLRRFNAEIIGGELKLTMDGLRKKILSLFSFDPNTELMLTYIDEDDDVVTLADADDLRDVVKQDLDPLRITVKVKAEKDKLHTRASADSAPLSSPHVQQPPLQNLNTGVPEILKTLPGPLYETLTKISADLASKASSSDFVQQPLQNLNTGVSQILGKVPEPLRESIEKVSADLATKAKVTAELLSKKRSSGPGMTTELLVHHFSKLGISLLDQLSQAQPGEGVTPEISTAATETRDSDTSKVDPAATALKVKSDVRSDNVSLEKPKPEATEDNEVEIQWTGVTKNESSENVNGAHPGNDSLPNSGRVYHSSVYPHNFGKKEFLVKKILKKVNGNNAGKRAGSSMLSSNVPFLVNNSTCDGPSDPLPGGFGKNAGPAPLPGNFNFPGLYSGFNQTYGCPFSGLGAGDGSAASPVVSESFRERREGYTDKAVVIRCVREDESSVTLKLYYLNNGSARVGFWIQGREYLLPVGIILKALAETSDHEIYVSLTCCYNEKYDRARGSVGTQLVGERAKIILDELQNLSLYTRTQCLKHIGEHFQPLMVGLEKESYSVIADAVLRDYIFVHLDDNNDKFNLLIFMLQKLFSLVDQTSVPDNPDSLQNQEVLLPGHLITIYLKEKLQDWLLRVKKALQDEVDSKTKKFELSSLADVRKVAEKNSPRQIGLAVENLLKTGRLVTQSGLDLQQRAGMTVMAERLNFLRFISHFRAVHRGTAFAGLRTTSVRKLLPESWGFLCPVHTPDGEPCGLLNHMTASCRITSYYDSEGNVKDFLEVRKSISKVLVSIGMTPSMPKLEQAAPPEILSVQLDGRVVGSIASDIVEKAVSHLRRLKVSTTSTIPEDLEVGYVPLSMGGTYPGLYLFTSASRFVRPVKNLLIPPEESNNIEHIGPFEQVYMEISCPDGGNGGRKDVFPATHDEIHPTGILSVVASLTPWSDHNQSPRNMYQCQMGKQTMGYSCQSLNVRADQKLYHLQTPQTPIVRTKAYEKYNVDDSPLGTNAIVAVLAYSGYDMEDAMVLNKSSVDRGMCRGYIYQTETIDLAEKILGSEHTQRSFGRSNLDKSSHHLIDSDGLPYVGQRIGPGEPYHSIYNEVTSSVTTTKLKGSDPAYVDYVAVDVKNKKRVDKANIRLRYPRNPIIGDKFSSRHGQKGVCSQLWPDIDMPFSGTSGMRPDLIINPHAFPSRMTIGMLLESIAAKGGALRGDFVDATPFSSSTSKKSDGSLVNELGTMLTARGFNYHGLEVLYSGVYGTELTCEIFIGPVYYQRLRHMVSDKFQVRSTGKLDQVTRQPIKGRKRGGGVRFGEMERDSLLAHGAAYLLHDRLHTSSDHHIADVCSLCGSILTTSIIQSRKREMMDMIGLPPLRGPKKVTCVSCRTSKGMETVAMPYVFRYLAAELAAMNIKMTLQLSNGAGA